jgi:hypothetical protein
MKPFPWPIFLFCYFGWVKQSVGRLCSLSMNTPGSEIHPKHTHTHCHQHTQTFRNVSHSTPTATLQPPIN